MTFIDLGVPARLDEVLRGLKFLTPTPIQQATLPDALAGRDVLGHGRTGSGKTLAFLLPLVARLSGGRRARAGTPRALILVPTRELATQIDTALRPLAAAAGLSACTIFGGVAQHPQVAALRAGTDIVIACPGRLEDLIKQRHCSLQHVQITVLDEADHMADLGFLPAVRRLLTQTPADGQRMLFSATLDRAVDGLVRQFLTDPATHHADASAPIVNTMTHRLLHLERADRLPVLVDLASAPDRTIVFTRTKHGAKALARQLNRSGVSAVELHGNLTQNNRTRNLDDFHTGRATTLVATDIAARGIHVDDVALVVHADPPADHKAYLHRSGRTARAGNSGTVITLMTTEQVGEVKRMIKQAGISATTTRIGSAERGALAKVVPHTPVDRSSRSRTAAADRPASHEPSTAPGHDRRRKAASSNRRRRPSSGGTSRSARSAVRP